MRNFMRRLTALILLLMAITTLSAQGRFKLRKQTLGNPENTPAPVFPIPSHRQLKWQQTEFYAFFHYGINTYTNLEWGKGSEPDSLFAPPRKPNPRQWLEAVAAAGMKGGIAVVKHHDGFCLWPTATTEHNVRNSGLPFEVNIPRDFADAARELGMKYGFYVSPWDRNSEYYGTDRYVSDVFLRQCAELAEFGSDQFEMWFDGANGGDGYYGGRNTTVQVDRETYYDVPNLRDSVHKVCPDCVMWGVGGEARWIGNEAGWAGETNWNTENRGFAPEKNGMYGTEDGWIWLPGESDAKATDQGWFWHSNERPRTPERLFQMYLETIGRGATLILNVPPSTEGILPEASVNMLRGLGELLRNRLSNDLAKTAHISVSDTRHSGASTTYRASNMTDGNWQTYWATNDGTTTATITLTWDEPQELRYLQMMEYVALGQRIRHFSIEISEDGVGNWQRCGTGATLTTVGYKRIVPLNGSTTDYPATGYKVKGIRVNITDCKSCVTLSNLSVY
ncbi:MAG: alpha-L-fucosidase [Prevotella sp.]|nr:alpha-L-fucosidase [Prevotella sp.]